MAGKVENHILNNALLSKNTVTLIKEESEDDDYIQADKMTEFGITIVDIKTELSSEICNDMRSGVEVKDEIRAIDGIQVEFKNDLLFCNNCREYYQDYCTKCGMLVHILNENALSNSYIKTRGDTPKDILEIRELFEYPGIYALKCIPKDVKFGPFTGLDAFECSWKLKGGRLVIADHELPHVNWMRYINSARDVLEGNLVAFRRENDLYYRSTCEIQVGDELLVYFGQEYEDDLNTDVEVNFIPVTEEDSKDVFACTLCCLGFGLREHLIEHKSVCFNESDRTFLIEELTQCTFCKIHMTKQDYLENHAGTYCCEKSSRLRQGVCLRRFNTREFLYMHVARHRVDTEPGPIPKQSTGDDLNGKRSRLRRLSQIETKQFKCATCSFRTAGRSAFTRHKKTQHPEEFVAQRDRSREDGIRAGANAGSRLRIRHVRVCDCGCAMCEHGTGRESNAEGRASKRADSMFDYKCDMCKFITDCRRSLAYHVRTKHPKIE